MNKLIFEPTPIVETTCHDSGQLSTKNPSPADSPLLPSTTSILANRGSTRSSTDSGDTASLSGNAILNPTYILTTPTKPSPLQPSPGTLAIPLRPILHIDTHSSAGLSPYKELSSSLITPTKNTNLNTNANPNPNTNTNMAAGLFTANNSGLFSGSRPTANTSTGGLFGGGTNAAPAWGNSLAGNISAGLFSGSSGGAGNRSNGMGLVGAGIAGNAKIMKSQEKEWVLFETSADKYPPGVQFRKEQEKVEMLFRNENDRVGPMQNPEILKAHKDPHGLNWLYPEAVNSTALSNNKITEFKPYESKSTKPKERKEKKQGPSDLSSAFLIEDTLHSKSSLKFKNDWKKDIGENSAGLSYRSFSPKYSKISITNGVSNLFIDPQSPRKLAKAMSDPITLKDFVPILTKKGYKTDPPIQVLQKYTMPQLKSIINFRIENEYGRIDYKNAIDLTGVDLDSVVIEKGMALISCDPRKFPPQGHGLNNPATVSLYNCKPAKPVPYNEFINVLTQLCTSHKAKFISWDRKSGDWVYQIQNFHQ